jgi:hypothetical protein
MAHWHGLAKLRMHNDLTLDILDTVTISLGNELRNFSQKTCPAFETRELEREYSARIRREGKKSAPKRRTTASASHADAPLQSDQATSPPTRQQPGSKSSTTGRRCKTFNLSTYKFHSYGDYVASIRKYGTTDSYSTEPVRGISVSPVADG